MKTIEVIRRENARQLAKQIGSDTEFAERVELSPSRVSQLIGKNPVKNIGHVTARRIEAAFGKNTGWLDATHDEKGMVATSAGGESGQASPGEMEIAANDEVSADEIMDLIVAYTNATKKERDSIRTMLRVAAKRAARKQNISRPE